MYMEGQHSCRRSGVAAIPGNHRDSPEDKLLAPRSTGVAVENLDQRDEPGAERADPTHWRNV